MKIILAIGIGSFLGGISRYLLSLLIQNRILTTFPFGTLTVNILACFLIGVVYGLSERGNVNSEWRLFLATGFLGGFSTFSSFSNETVSLLRDGQLWYAFGYVISSLAMGFAATFGGVSLIKLF
jgi:fluoride exporter